MTTLGKRIEKERKIKGFTLAALGSYAGVSKSTIWQWENDRIKNPIASNLLPIALALGVNPDYLLYGKGDKYVKTLNNTGNEVVESTKQYKESTTQYSEPMNPNTIEHLFNLRCKTKTWIMFLIGNSDNKNMGIDEYLALSRAYEMLGNLLEDKRKELTVDKEKI